VPVDAPKALIPEEAKQDVKEAKRLKKAKYDAIELKPLSTERLKPIKVEN